MKQQYMADCCNRSILNSLHIASL